MLGKVIFWRKTFSPAFMQLPVKSCTFAAIRVQLKKWDLKDQEMSNIYFMKKNAEKNGMFQIMLKGGNKHKKIICDTCSKLSIQIHNQYHMLSIWTTFNNPCGVLMANL